METDSSEQSNRLETVVAILIALTTVIGAIVAWRASVAADGAGDADFAGLQASLNAEQARALNFVDAYEHYGAYTSYSRYSQLGELISQDLQNGPALSEQEAFMLDRQRADAFDLAKANQDLFPNRFLSRDGTYNVARDMGESTADAARAKDLNPEPHYAEADQLRTKTNLLLITLAVLGVSLVFYTLVETANERLQGMMVVLGTLFLIGGTVAALIIEFTQ